MCSYVDLAIMHSAGKRGLIAGIIILCIPEAEVWAYIIPPRPPRAMIGIYDLLFGSTIDTGSQVGSFYIGINSTNK